jgi:hypothetical protein
MDDLTRVFENFVDPQDCAAIIARIEDLCAAGEVVERPDGRVGIINSSDPTFTTCVEKYTQKKLDTIHDGFETYNGYIVTKYVTGVGMSTHVDSAEGEEMGLLMYLNDDYEGGELVYTTPDNTVHTIKPEKGSMIYSPSWYPHSVNPVTKGTRYFFTLSLLNVVTNNR